MFDFELTAMVQQIQRECSYFTSVFISIFNRQSGHDLESTQLPKTKFDCIWLNSKTHHVGVTNCFNFVDIEIV